MQQADRMQPVEALDAGLALDLSGSWRFELDPDDVGTAQAAQLAGEISCQAAPGPLRQRRNPTRLGWPWRGGDWYNDPQYARPAGGGAAVSFGCSRKALYGRRLVPTDAHPYAGAGAARMERVHGRTVWVDDASWKRRHAVGTPRV